MIFSRLCKNQGSIRPPMVPRIWGTRGVYQTTSKTATSILPLELIRLERPSMMICRCWRRRSSTTECTWVLTVGRLISRSMKISNRWRRSRDRRHQTKWLRRKVRWLVSWRGPGHSLLSWRQCCWTSIVLTIRMMIVKAIRRRSRYNRNSKKK